MILVVRIPFVSVRYFNAQTFPSGEACQSPPIRICLPAIPGRVLGFEVTSHNSGKAWVSVKNADFFIFGWYRWKNFCKKLSHPVTLGVFDVGAKTKIAVWVWLWWSESKGCSTSCRLGSSFSRRYYSNNCLRSAWFLRAQTSLTVVTWTASPFDREPNRSRGSILARKMVWITSRSQLLKKVKE